MTTGQLLAQRYLLGRRIAVGGMGEVWAAEDTRLGRQVAVKVLKPELSGDPEFRSRFHTEARLTASLNHPGIAAVYDYGETAAVPSGAPGAVPSGAPGAVTSGAPGGADTAFLVMELVAGEPLSAILLQHARLSVDSTLDILGQAGDALQAAHERGLVHRDIKPGNILITPTGKVKLTDFGIAKAVDAVPVTRQGMVMGTAHYIAPEQAAGHKAGPASDVYSLGVVGYECLAGQRPFPADSAVAVAMMHVHHTPPPLPPDVPPGARALIEATLVKDPRQRYRTGGEFAAAVGAVRAGHRLPLPAGLASAAATTALTGHHPPRTALLPPWALSGPLPTSSSGPPTGPRGGSYSGGYPPQRQSGRRTVIGVALALFAVLVLVLSSYLIREMVRSTDAVPGSGTGASGTEAPPAPGPTAEPAPAPPPPPPDEDDEEPTPAPTRETTPAEDEPADVFVMPTDYLFRSGDDAAATARSQSLLPQVVDQDGEEVDPDKQSDCRVIGVDQAGPVPPGSTLELTCREGI